MIKSDVEYIRDLKELDLGVYDPNTDYVLKAEYPLKSEMFERLLDIEMQRASILETVYLEFDKLNLTGRQVLNMSNNINLNVLIKEPTNKQMEELLEGYTNMDMKKTVYPAKIIVLVTLYGLYMREFYNVDVMDKWEEMVDAVLEKYVLYKYIEGKYTRDFIIDWSQWYMLYLLKERTDFVADYRKHCAYLFDTAYQYYTSAEVLPPKEPGKGLKSGIYVPLAFIMRDMRFNPYRAIIKRKEYDYATSMFAKSVIEALGPAVDFTIAAEQYTECKDKGIERVEKLADLKEKDIVRILKDKKRIITKDGQSGVYLFPIEVEVEQVAGNKEHEQVQP